jgi:hypothetical protein
MVGGLYEERQYWAKLHEQILCYSQTLEAGRRSNFIYGLGVFIGH